MLKVETRYTLFFNDDSRAKNDLAFFSGELMCADKSKDSIFLNFSSGWGKICRSGKYIVVSPQRILADPPIEPVNDN